MRNKISNIVKTLEQNNIKYNIERGRYNIVLFYLFNQTFKYDTLSNVITHNDKPIDFDLDTLITKEYVTPLFHFGRYKGKSMEFIIEIDNDERYINWFITKFDAETEEDKILLEAITNNYNIYKQHRQNLDDLLFEYDREDFLTGKEIKERQYKELAIFTNKKNTIKRFTQYDIEYREVKDNFIFDIMNIEYLFNTELNRVFKGDVNTELTLYKFLKRYYEK